MRIPYLILVFFVLLGIGATCRTPALLPDECEPVAGGLVRCAGPAAEPRA
jgi:hypothetical protein